MQNSHAQVKACGPEAPGRGDHSLLRLDHRPPPFSRLRLVSGPPAQPRLGEDTPGVDLAEEEVPSRSAQDEVRSDGSLSPRESFRRWCEGEPVERGGAGSVAQVDDFGLAAASLHSSEWGAS